MSGYRAGLRNDKDYVKEQIGRLQAPSNSFMDIRRYQNPNTCLRGYDNNNQRNGQYGFDIDAENSLLYPNYLSKSNVRELPKKIPKYQETVMCDDRMITDYTRMSNPAYKLRGLTTEDMRLDYPLFDPQCNIFQSFAVNARQKSKDDFVATWNIPMKN